MIYWPGETYEESEVEMNLTREEMETIILFDEENQVARVYTASKLVRNRMVKAGIKPVRTEPGGWFFEVDKQAVRLKPAGCRSAIRLGGRALPSRIDATCLESGKGGISVEVKPETSTTGKGDKRRRSKGAS